MGRKNVSNFLRSSFQLKNLSFNPSIKSDLINHFFLYWIKYHQLTPTQQTWKITNNEIEDQTTNLYIDFITIRIK